MLYSLARSVQERNKFLAMRGQGFDRHLFGLYLMAKYLKLDPFPAFLNGNVSGNQYLYTPHTYIHIVRASIHEYTYIHPILVILVHMYKATCNNVLYVCVYIVQQHHM